METYANQKIVRIQKQLEATDYLRVNNEDWHAAAKELKPTTFILYLWLASNTDGWEFALSPKAITRETGISKKSYDRGVDELLEMGYMCREHGNRYLFSTVAQDEWKNDL